MSDRELLELAAKAAGLALLDWRDDWADYGPGWRYKDTHGCKEIWNAMTDDGDALRLARDLNISIGGVKHETGVRMPAHGYVQANEIREDYSGYSTARYAATRRAIVRAAAEIGKAMP